MEGASKKEYKEHEEYEEYEYENRTGKLRIARTMKLTPVPAILEAWLISLANKWRQEVAACFPCPGRRGFGFGSYAQARVEIKTIESLDQIVSRNCLDETLTTAPNTIRDLFLLISQVIKKLDTSVISHDLARSCLILLLFMNGPFPKSFKEDRRFLEDALYFLDGFVKPFDEDIIIENSEDDKLILNYIIWDFIKPPWTAKAYLTHQDRYMPINFSRPLFNVNNLTIYVSDYRGRKEVEVTPSGNTVYDVLKSLYDVYRRKVKWHIGLFDGVYKDTDTSWSVMQGS